MDFYQDNTELFLKKPIIKKPNMKKIPQFFDNYKKLALQFTPYAWLKIVFVNNLATSEFSAFGISRPNNLLIVEDIAILKQADTGGSTRFDDVAVSDYFENQVDAGRKPDEFARIWIHTHPNGDSFLRYKGGKRIFTDNYIPCPSQTDEKTFRQAFGICDWSVMFIYAGGTNCYARLALRDKKFDGEIMLPVEILKNGRLPGPQDKETWMQEFEQNIKVEKYLSSKFWEELENEEKKFEQ